MLLHCIALGQEHSNQSRATCKSRQHAANQKQLQLESKARQRAEAHPESVPLEAHTRRQVLDFVQQNTDVLAGLAGGTLPPLPACSPCWS
jgi:hypothetical protein